MTDRPLGIFGGTFDPVHTAHLRLAEEATRQLRLDGVIWNPAGQAYHRSSVATAAMHRLAMVRLAVAGHPEYRVDDTEILDNAPGYTVQTLERLRTAYGNQRSLVLLMGADAFLKLSSWYRWQDLFRLAHVGVASRPGSELSVEAMPADLAEEFLRCRNSQVTALATSSAGAVVTFPLSAGTVSSTEVRARLRDGHSADELLPAPVLDYIRRHRLYTD